MDRRKFFDAVRGKPFGGSLNVPQVDGMSAILDEWEKRGMTDLRWLAYMLATTYHETARTMQPIAEYGKGKGRKYGTPVGPYRKVYYGRGFVQLTWLTNYEKASEVTGVNLVRYPEKAMEPAIAAQIMFDGMRDGWFTGKKLGDYFKGSHLSGSADWRNARRIINGLDKADTIAGYGKAFYAALLKADDGTAPVKDSPVILPPEPSPPPPDIPAPEITPNPAIEPGFSFPEEPTEGTSVMRHVMAILVFVLFGLAVGEFMGIVDFISFIGK